MDFFKSIGGKIASGVVGLLVVIAAISYYMATPETRASVIGGIFSVLGWLLLVVAAPWALFLVIQWVEKFKSNAVSFAFVALLTIVEAVVWFWLWNWTMGSAVAWTFSIGAVLLAGVYNVFTSDWIAEQMG
jgi:Kef-type K+ transport system membrane component KefB